MFEDMRFGVMMYRTKLIQVVGAKFESPTDKFDASVQILRLLAFCLILGQKVGCQGSLVLVGASTQVQGHLVAAMPHDSIIIQYNSNTVASQYDPL